MHRDERSAAQSFSPTAGAATGRHCDRSATGSIGKTTLVERLAAAPSAPSRGPAIQRKAAADRGDRAAQLTSAGEAAAPARPGIDALFGRASAGSVASPAPQGAGPAPAATGGSVLPDAVRGRMERSFGADFSSVRVHQDGGAERIGAVAYARGSDLHFASGQYDPHGAAGQHLLAHELTHVVQQGQGRVAPTLQAKGLGINDDVGLEREADDCADRMGRGEPARPAAGARVTAPARGDAPVQGFFRTNDFKVQHKDQQAPFTTQSPRPEVKPNQDGSGIDVARSGGPVVPTDVALRVADDLTVAVHDTGDEPKEFYATKHVVATANAKLAETESSFRLDNQGGNSLAVGPNQLAMVKPVNHKAQDKQDGSEDGKVQFASLIRDVCIEVASELVGNGGSWAGLEAVFRNRDSGESFTEQINPDPERDEKVNRLGAHLSQTGDEATPDDAQRAMNGKDPLPPEYARDYGRRQGRKQLDAQNRQLGINEHALPDVGESYAIFSQSSESRPHGDYSARSDGGAVHRPDIWGYHFAGVVARSAQGDDRVCLENYNRSAPLKDPTRAALLDLDKFREDARTCRQLDAAKHPEDYSASATNPGDALGRVVNAVISKNSDAYDALNQAMTAEETERLWFFRMYGTREGQSFHEQQSADGGVVNPITLHVQRSLPAQKQAKSELVDHNIARYVAALGAVSLPGGAARDELQRLVTALTKEGTECKALVAGAVDNAALMTAVRAVKARFTRFIEGELVAGLRRVYGHIVHDKAAGDGLDRKGLVDAIHRGLTLSLFDLLGDFFFEMAQGLPDDEQVRRDSLEGLRAILAALPSTAFDEVERGNKLPSPKATAFDNTNFAPRFGGHDRDDTSLASSQLGLFLALNHLRLQETVSDGDCLYDALRLQLQQVQHLAVSTGALRIAVAALINANAGTFAPFLTRGVDTAVNRIMTARSWDNEGGDLAAQVIATVLQRDVIVISPAGIDIRHPNNGLTRPSAALIQSNGQPLTIVYNGRNHYYSTSPL